MPATIPPRPIKRLLVANRGEIATRILSTARELDLETYATYTENDTSHAHTAAHALALPSPASYTDTAALVALAKHHDIDAVHPGYGFLSESAAFASAMADAEIAVVGPGAEILQRTGDKLAARQLAVACAVPVLPALEEATGSVDAVRRFAREVGLPVMIKAVDGGGGRGIRLVREWGGLEGLVERAVMESPSRRVFVEKAAVDGWRHVEVQVLGDGEGGVRHLWERECSLQRRYQKVVELAVSTVEDRGLVGRVIEAAVRMAREIRYRSLGTFEFLLNPKTRDFFFLEINPRLQVEHTITESICSLDIVKIQLQLAQGLSLEQTDLAGFSQESSSLPPTQRSIQLRVTAEDPEKNYTLSIGKIQSFHFPSGNGVRVDTHLVNHTPCIVSADFDSVIAKIILTAPTWADVVRKARRALQDTAVTGIKTNVDMLSAIVEHPDFLAGNCDTQWLETHHEELLALSRSIRKAKPSPLTTPRQQAPSLSPASSSTTPLFRPNDAWNLTLTPKNQSQPASQALPHHLHLTRILRNDFPTSLAAEITHTPPSSAPQTYTLALASTSSSARANQHRLGSPADPSHVIVPFAGTLVEVLVDVGDEVREGDVVCVVRQMKMELEVRCRRGGVVGFVMGVEEGEEVAEGVLAAVVEAGLGDCGRARL
ncbi:hypothetical protein Q7P37_006348 [Cladosporium fusiforme]